MAWATINSETLFPGLSKRYIFGKFNLAPEKNILKMSRIWNEKFALASRHSMCAYQFSRKTGLCKKKLQVNKLFNTKFCSFYTTQKNVRFP
jgi:hypothetical protein